MGKIPGIKTQKFYEKRAVVEAIAIGPPIIAASMAAYVNLMDPTKRQAGILLVLGAVWLIIASILKVLNANALDKEVKSKQDYDGLLGAVHVLYGLISKHQNFQETDQKRLRITLHRVIPSEQADQNPEELEQLLPYIGGQGGSPGRKFSIRSGIIGLAARNKAPYVFARQNDDYEAFIKELVASWSYTEQDARQLTSDRQSWMAIPIFGKDGSVVGVVYLDSNQKNFFDEPVKGLILDAYHGIASYVDERYP